MNFSLSLHLVPATPEPMDFSRTDNQQSTNSSNQFHASGEGGSDVKKANEKNAFLMYPSAKDMYQGSQNNNNVFGKLCDYRANQGNANENLLSDDNSDEESSDVDIVGDIKSQNIG